MRFIILGHAGHGKDTVALLLKKYLGMKNFDTSRYVCNKIVFPLLKNFYSSIEECYSDRINNRPLWYKLVREYNSDDKAKLAREILDMCGMYVGLRDRQEFIAIKKENPDIVVIWVEATDRLSTKEGKSSFNLTKEDAHLTIYNNGTIQDLEIITQLTAYELYHKLDF